MKLEQINKIRYLDDKKQGVVIIGNNGEEIVVPVLTKGYNGHSLYVKWIANGKSIDEPIGKKDKSMLAMTINDRIAKEVISYDDNRYNLRDLISNNQLTLQLETANTNFNLELTDKSNIKELRNDYYVTKFTYVTDIEGNINKLNLVELSTLLTNATNRYNEIIESEVE